jgi:hypothetical protein
MAIVRAQDEVYESTEGVHFLMRDDIAWKNIPCLITREALAERGSAYQPLDPMQVFTIHRDEIERVAGDCWERGEIDPRGIVRITSARFSKSPAEKHFK